MAYLNWSADLETGIEMVDQDHKVLVDLLNQVFDCLDDDERAVTLGSVLNALTDYTRYHFTREERLMEAAHFPSVESHKVFHKALMDRTSEFKLAHARDPDKVDAQALLEFLRSWLIDHILKEDFQYRAAVMAHPEAVRVAASIPFGRLGDPSGDLAPDNDETMPDPLLPPRPDFGAMSVLVVDDNQNFQVILRTILKGLGCPSVSLVSDAEAGLAVLKGGLPNLILVDWRMEGVDGLEFVRRVRDMNIATPIIMISGYNEPGFAETARAAGVDAFLEKPITARNLTETVASALAGR